MMTLKEVIKRELRSMLKDSYNYIIFKWKGVFFKLYRDGTLIELGKYPKSIDRPQDWFDHIEDDEEWND